MGVLEGLRALFAGVRPLEELIPWTAPLTDDLQIMMTEVGGLSTTAVVDLPDHDSTPEAELDGYHERLLPILQRPTTGTTIYLDEWRLERPEYLEKSDFDGNYAAKLVDQCRRRQYLSGGRKVYGITVFLTIHWKPTIEGRLQEWLQEHEGPEVIGLIHGYQNNCRELFARLAPHVRAIEYLKGDDLATYMKSTCTLRPRKVPFPAAPDIRTQLKGSTRWRTKPHVEIDGRYVKTVEITNWGGPNARSADALHTLPFEFRRCFTLDALSLNDQRAEITKIDNDWRMKQLGVGTVLQRHWSRNPNAGETNPEADVARAYLRELKGKLRDQPFAKCTGNIHVWGDTPAEALTKAAKVAAIFGEAVEASTARWNAVRCITGDMPGNLSDKTDNKRRQRVYIRSWTRLGPWTGPTYGHRWDERFKGPAIKMGLTAGGLPFYVSLNRPGSDTSHFAMFGTSGFGKSFNLSEFLCSFARYPDSTAILYDRNRSARIAILCLGGDWVDLIRDGVQPLRYIDRPGGLIWGHEWVIKALKARNVPITQQLDHAIAEALHLVAKLPPDERTLTNLAAHLGGNDIARNGLRHYMKGGPAGTIFDRVIRSYGTSRFVGVETLDISELETDGPLALSAMFYALRVERFSRPGPKLFLWDEFNQITRHPLFANEADTAALEMRKLEGVLGVATQTARHLLDPKHNALRQQCGMMIALPNPQVLEPDVFDDYERLGFRPSDIKHLPSAIPKDQVLVKIGHYAKLVSWGAEKGDIIRICGSSLIKDHLRADELLDRGHVPGEDFCRAWLDEPYEVWERRRFEVRLKEAA